jgi:hypothetical protein
MSGPTGRDLRALEELAEAFELLRDALLGLLGLNRPPERPPTPRSPEAEG